MNNPLQDFVLQQIDHFASEAKRLQDRAPLLEYKKLIDTFYFIHGKLDTLEHEVALAKLSSEFNVASSEARDAWRTIWNDFRTQRKDAIQTERSFAEHNQKASETIAKLEKDYLEMTEENQKLRQSMRSTIDAMKHATVASKDFGTGWRRGSWLVLWVNLQIFTVYLRYFATKISFILFRHSFIFVVSILVLGIAYSKASVAIVEYLAALLPQWPWVAVVLSVCGYLLKKYYFDPKVKKIQTKLETRRLRPLSFHLHIVRTMALVSRTARRDAPTQT